MNSLTIFQERSNMLISDISELSDSIIYYSGKDCVRRYNDKIVEFYHKSVGLTGRLPDLIDIINQIEENNYKIYEDIALIELLQYESYEYMSPEEIEDAISESVDNQMEMVDYNYSWGLNGRGSEYCICQMIIKILNNNCLEIIIDEQSQELIFDDYSEELKLIEHITEIEDYSYFIANDSQNYILPMMITEGIIGYSGKIAFYPELSNAYDV